MEHRTWLTVGGSENGGSERVWSLPEVTQLVCFRVRF